MEDMIRFVKIKAKNVRNLTVYFATSNDVVAFISDFPTWVES